MHEKTMIKCCFVQASILSTYSDYLGTSNNIQQEPKKFILSWVDLPMTKLDQVGKTHIKQQVIKIKFNRVENVINA